MKNLLIITAVSLLTAGQILGAELWVGAAEVSITPERQVSLAGQFHQRIAHSVESPCMAGVLVLDFCGPAGNEMPRPMLRKAVEERMEKLRKISRKQEVGRRIVRAFDETWEVIRQDIRTDVPLVHRVECFTLPKRKITDAESQEARKQSAAYAAQVDASEKEEKTNTSAKGYTNWFKRTVDMYDAQQKAEVFHPIEMHVLRLGDVAIATNPFELFQDYAMRIHGGRSKAPQTMLIQLASPVDVNYDGYLPSERAVKGGGYSAIPQFQVTGRAKQSLSRTLS